MMTLELCFFSSPNTVNLAFQDSPIKAVFLYKVISNIEFSQQIFKCKYRQRTKVKHHINQSTSFVYLYWEKIQYYHPKFMYLCYAHIIFGILWWVRGGAICVFKHGRATTYNNIIWWYTQHYSFCSQFLSHAVWTFLGGISKSTKKNCLKLNKYHLRSKYHLQW